MEFVFKVKKKHTHTTILPVAGGRIIVYLYISSSSSGRAGSTDRHDSLPPLLPIRHRSWQVLRVASRILAELFDVGLRRPSRSGASVCGGPQEHVAY